MSQVLAYIEARGMRYSVGKFDTFAQAESACVEAAQTVESQGTTIAHAGTTDREIPTHHEWQDLLHPEGAVA